MIEIKSTDFEHVGKDKWGNKYGNVQVNFHRLHKRRYCNVLESEYRQWTDSMYNDNRIPASMTEFVTWKAIERAKASQA